LLCEARTAEDGWLRRGLETGRMLDGEAIYIYIYISAGILVWKLGGRLEVGHWRRDRKGTGVLWWVEIYGRGVWFCNRFVRHVQVQVEV
jgi:hypothetical protein